ncbi:MAG: hypothetical protein AB7K09_09000 [Planctomycetota bacterium]
MGNLTGVAGTVVAAVIGGCVGAGVIALLLPPPGPVHAAPPAAGNTAPPAASADDAATPPTLNVDKLVARIDELEQLHVQALAATDDRIRALQADLARARAATENEAPAAPPAAGATDATAQDFDAAVRAAFDRETQRRDELAKRAAEQARLDKEAAQRQETHAALERYNRTIIDRIDELVTLYPAQRDAIDRMLRGYSDDYEKLLERARVAKQNGETDWSWWIDAAETFERGPLDEVRAQLDATQNAALNEALGDHGLGVLINPDKKK